MEVPLTIFIFLSFYANLFGCSDLTVDEYDKLINDFIQKTQSYKYPTSSKSFVTGNLDQTGN